MRSTRRQAEQRARAQAAAAVVGVDCGKFEHCMVMRPRGGQDSKPFRFQTTREGFDAAAARILKLAGSAPEQVLVGIELAGVYGMTFAHYLHQAGFQVVSVLPSHTKKWKEVMHRQPLKTDPKDSATITDLVSMGQFVTYAFLRTELAELRYLVSARDNLVGHKYRAQSRLRCVLHVVWPEFERVFPKFQYVTPLKLLGVYPGAEDLLAAPKHRVIKLIKALSRNHLGERTYERLREAAEQTVGLPIAQGELKGEIPLLIELIETYGRHIEQLEKRMEEILLSIPEGPCLLSIPGVSITSAALFLGLIGDPQAYQSSRQVIKAAGLSLVETSSGQSQGKHRISKRGKPELRRQGWMLAMASIRYDGMFKARFDERYTRKGKGAPKKPIIVALMKDFLCLMFSIAKERRMYTVEPPAPATLERTAAAAD